jgi:hypothetical protein
MKTFRKLAAVVFMGLSLMVAVPSSAEPGMRPSGWDPVGVEANTSGDRNGNGIVCAKSVGGSENARTNSHDDRG